MYTLNIVTYESVLFTEDLCKINVKSAEKLVSEPLSFFTHTYHVKIFKWVFCKVMPGNTKRMWLRGGGLKYVLCFSIYFTFCGFRIYWCTSSICFFTLSVCDFPLCTFFFLHYLQSVKWLLLYCSLFYWLWLFSHMKPTRWNSHVKTSSVVALSRSW